MHLQKSPGLTGWNSSFVALLERSDLLLEGVMAFFSIRQWSPTHFALQSNRLSSCDLTT